MPTTPSASAASVSDVTNSRTLLVLIPIYGFPPLQVREFRPLVRV